MPDIGFLHKREFELCGRSGEISHIIVGEAPGRVHYLGDNCQREAGRFLSSAVSCSLRVALSPRTDGMFRFYAANFEERKRSSLASIAFRREDRWANYLKAPASLFFSLGYPEQGFNFTVSGDLPRHAALSASGAIVTAAALALRRYYKAKLTDQQLAVALAEMQKEYFQREVSIVEYMTHIFAKSNMFLLTDEATLDITYLKSPFGRYRIVMTDSRVPMLGVNENIDDRRSDIDTTVKFLAKMRPAKRGRGDKAALPDLKPQLRDFVNGDLDEELDEMDDDVSRHTRHAVNELRAVDVAAKAVVDNDAAAFSRTVYHSHESLRDLYEVSCPEIDWLVKRAQETEGTLAARLTGRGFGGCTWALMLPDAIPRYEKRMDDYDRIFGFRPVIYEMKTGPGARIVFDGQASEIKTSGDKNSKTKRDDEK